MADWFRWWHGSVTDQKFGAVCVHAKCSLPEVIAIWATLLEHASQAEDRGDVSDCPANEIAWNLRIDDATVQRCIVAMGKRGLIVDGRIAGWERRQPAREDAVSAKSKTSTERSRERRERLKSQQNQQHDLDATQCNADATQCNAYATHQSRAEQSRAEQSKPLSSVVENSTGVARENPLPAALLDPIPEIPDPPPTRRGIVCRLLRQAGVADAAPHHLTDEDWNAILAKRTDEEIVEYARAKLASRSGQRTGLKYLAPGLLEDPEQIRPNGGKNGASGPPWWSSNAAMVAKGKEIGIEPRPGEDWSAFKGRIETRLTAQGAAA